MQGWYNLWNPEQSQENTRWKLTSTFCLHVNGELKLSEEPQEKGLCSGQSQAGWIPAPLITLSNPKSFWKSKNTQQDNSVFSLLWVPYLLLKDEIFCVSENETDPHHSELWFKVWVFLNHSQIGV